MKSFFESYNLKIILFLISTIITFGAYITSPSIGVKNKMAENNKLNVVLEAINKSYIDSVNAGFLEDMAIYNLVSNLDPHSGYIPVREASYPGYSAPVKRGGFSIYYAKSDSKYF